MAIAAIAMIAVRQAVRARRQGERRYRSVLRSVGMLVVREADAEGHHDQERPAVDEAQLVVEEPGVVARLAPKARHRAQVEGAGDQRDPDGIARPFGPVTVVVSACRAPRRWWCCTGRRPVCRKGHRSPGRRRPGCRRRQRGASVSTERRAGQSDVRARRVRHGGPVVAGGVCRYHPMPPGSPRRPGPARAAGRSSYGQGLATGVRRDSSARPMRVVVQSILPTRRHGRQVRDSMNVSPAFTVRGVRCPG